MFGASINLLNGKGIKLRSYPAGDANSPVTIQSVSKLFQALIAQRDNPEEFKKLVGTSFSGMPFDAVTSIQSAMNETAQKPNNKPNISSDDLSKILDSMNSKHPDSCFKPL